MRSFLTLLFILMSFNSLSDTIELSKAVGIENYVNNQFSIIRKTPFVMTLNIKQPLVLSVDIVSADKDKVRTILTEKKLVAGKINVEWDGKDAAGKFVPNEAWYPVISVYQDNKVTSIYPTDYSGGEIINDVPVVVTGGKLVSVTLSEPARLLVRAGLRAGPMLRALVSWEARAQGVHKIHWNGLDESGVYSFTHSDDFAVMATAFKLADHAIITYGNDKLSYAQWRKQAGLKQSFADSVGQITEKRDDKALSKVFFKPKYLPVDPQVSVQLLNTVGDIPILSEITTLKVDMDKFDRGLVEKSLYEVGFFVDGLFVSEEEQGYVPFNWRFDPKHFTPGEHHLTVNISGFDGQVGIASVKFISPDK